MKYYKYFIKSGWWSQVQILLQTFKNFIIKIINGEEKEAEAKI